MMSCTEGFARLLSCEGQSTHPWQQTLIGEYMSCVRTRQAAMLTLNEGQSISWETGPVVPCGETGKTLIVFPMGMGMGPDGYMPSGEFILSVNGKSVIEFCAVKYSTLWDQGGARLYYEVKRKETAPETYTAGLGYLLVPMAGLEAGEPAVLSITNRKKAYTRFCRAPFSPRWVRIDAYSGVLADNVYMENGLEAVFAERRRSEWNDRTLLFGDIHSHCGRLETLSDEGEQEFLREGVPCNCGIGEPESYYRFARDVAGLDFFCLTDHNRGAFGPRDWALRCQLAEQWRSPTFVPLLGYEFLGGEIGHWCVYFRSASVDYPPGDDCTPEEAKEFVRRNGPGLFFPHQVPTYCGRPVDWDALDPELSPLVEIYSHWGSGEYFGNPLQCREVDVHPECFADTALAQGHKLGFIASSDEHNGAPGNGTTNHNPLGTGLACVWTEEFSRDGIFSALQTRHCYATTGARIELRFSMDDVPMGQTGKRHDKPVARLELRTPEDVEELVLLKNGQEVVVETPRRASELTWEWEDPEPATERLVDYFYPRVVLKDGETAWGSPVWLEKVQP